MKRPANADKGGKGPEGPVSPVELVLGIDPGSICCGYGLVRMKKGECLYVSSGRIRMTAGAPLARRLTELFEGLSEVVREFSPQACAVEKIFFAKSVRSALSLGHARGIALLAGAMSGVPVYEYSPLEIKKAVTGYGRAEKSQVQAMIMRLLGLSFSPSTDGADALALALCHLHRQGMP